MHTAGTVGSRGLGCVRNACCSQCMDRAAEPILEELGWNTVRVRCVW
jgi:hypothetical protein